MEFEPHADIIVKGGRDVQYGHKLNLTTGSSGLILDVVIEAGNPADVERFLPMLDRQIDRCGSGAAIGEGDVLKADRAGKFGAQPARGSVDLQRPVQHRPGSPIAALTSSYSCTSRARPTSGCATRPLSIMNANNPPTM